LNDSRFAPIIDVHLDRLAPASLKTGMLNPPSPRSSPGSFQSSRQNYPSSPMTVLDGYSNLSLPLHDQLDDLPQKPQSSPRPPFRKLAPPMPIPYEPTPVINNPVRPRMVPLSPTHEAPTRPLPRAPRREMGSQDSTNSTLHSKLSIGTFGH